MDTLVNVVKVSIVVRLQFVAMTGQFAALCMASGIRAHELWHAFLTAMELDQAQMVADAQVPPI